MHACIHTYMHAYIHACIHTCMHACMHACIHTYIYIGSRCGRADSVLDSHTTGPGFKTRLVRYFLLSFRLLTTMTASS